VAGNNSRNTIDTISAADFSPSFRHARSRAISPARPVAGSFDMLLDIARIAKIFGIMLRKAERAG